MYDYPINLERPEITTDFKAFLRKNKLTIETFFELKLNKKDLLTGEKIPFKNVTQYVLHDFNDKRNIARYLEKLTREKAQEYLRKKISQRIFEKHPIFILSQTELRSIKYIPSINIIEKYFDNYEDVYGDVIIKKRFDYKKELISIPCSPTILQDTREQKPLKFQSPAKIQKLDFGDYTYEGENYHNIHWERKSIIDLFGTMSELNGEDSNFNRFQRELARAQTQNCYIVVVVDYKFSDAQSYNFKQVFSKMKPDIVFYNIRSLMQSYGDVVQFVFTGGRDESAKLIEQAASFGEDIRKIDLQYCLDMKKIILK